MSRAAQGPYAEIEDEYIAAEVPSYRARVIVVVETLSME
jgi:hypothetical protein